MLLTWLQKNFPGKLEQKERYVRIWHDSGNTSTFWYLKSSKVSKGKMPGCLNGFYEKFQAADILSSTFKISSQDCEIIENDVRLVYSQPQLEEIAKKSDASFTKGSVPFMMQTGMWLYAYSSNTIYEWDLEYGEMSDEFPDLISILEEWRQNVK